MRGHRRGESSTLTKALSIVAAALLTLLTAVFVSPVAASQYWGATIGTHFTGTVPPWDWKAVTAFQKVNAAGKPLSVLEWGSPFYSTKWCDGYCGFQTFQFNKVRGNGVIPSLSWGSYDADWFTAYGYTDAQIASGSQDAYITDWAQDAKAWAHPFFLRFDWEMNLDQFGWGVGANWNRASDYVAMWRHVHDIFTKVGAVNATWVWCPNVDPDNAFAPLLSLYPGDAYVDWTCLDGYNGGDPWTSFTELFTSTYDLITSTIAPSKPMIIGEVGSTEPGGSKAHWISDTFSALPTRFPQIRGLLWFDAYARGPGGRYDWPIDTSSASEVAFTMGIESSAYESNTNRDLDTSPVPPPG
jgi:hypothetical protein